MPMIEPATAVAISQRKILASVLYIRQRDFEYGDAGPFERRNGASCAYLLVREPKDTRNAVASVRSRA